MTKACALCKDVKAIDQFHMDRRRRGGLTSYCKACAGAKSRAWYAANKERCADQARQRYDPVKQKIQADRWTANNPGRRAEICRNNRRKQFGFTPGIVQLLYRDQGGACAICMAAITAETADADHDHNTNTPRGLLCRVCNIALGLFRDDRDRFIAAAKYLDQSPYSRLMSGKTGVRDAVGNR